MGPRTLEKILFKKSKNICLLILERTFIKNPQQWVCFSLNLFLNPRLFLKKIYIKIIFLTNPTIRDLRRNIDQKKKKYLSKNKRFFHWRSLKKYCLKIQDYWYFSPSKNHILDDPGNNESYESLSTDGPWLRSLKILCKNPYFWHQWLLKKYSFQIPVLGIEGLSNS